MSYGCQLATKGATSIVMLLVDVVASLLVDARECLVTYAQGTELDIACYEITCMTITCGMTKGVRMCR